MEADYKRYGEGTSTWIHKDGSNTYFGQWKDDKFHGAGVYTKADGSKYEGYWNNDVRHGYGM